MPGNHDPQFLDPEIQKELTEAALSHRQSRNNGRTGSVQRSRGLHFAAAIGEVFIHAPAPSRPTCNQNSAGDYTNKDAEIKQTLGLGANQAQPRDRPSRARRPSKRRAFEMLLRLRTWGEVQHAWVTFLPIRPIRTACHHATPRPRLRCSVGSIVHGRDATGEPNLDLEKATGAWKALTDTVPFDARMPLPLRPETLKLNALLGVPYATLCAKSDAKRKQSRSSSS